MKFLNSEKYYSTAYSGCDPEGNPIPLAFLFPQSWLRYAVPIGDPHAPLWIVEKLDDGLYIISHVQYGKVLCYREGNAFYQVAPAAVRRTLG